jgi:hypothetical protein
MISYGYGDIRVGAGPSLTKMSGNTAQRGPGTERLLLGLGTKFHKIGGLETDPTEAERYFVI